MKHTINPVLVLRLTDGTSCLVTPQWWDRFLARMDGEKVLDTRTPIRTSISKREVLKPNGLAQVR